MGTSQYTKAIEAAFVSQPDRGNRDLKMEVAVRNQGEGCCKSGPGYATPLLAMSGPREKLIYVAAIYTGKLICCPLYTYRVELRVLKIKFGFKLRCVDSWFLETGLV